MRKSSAFLLLLFFQSFETNVKGSESASWDSIPSQQVDSQYNQNFSFKHDRGFYLSLGLGPQWNQSLQNPAAGAFRFGGKFAIGFVPTPNLAVHADVWGNFLEQSSLVAVGPGVTYFLDSNVGLGASIGVAQAFSTGFSPSERFRETVLATEISAGKYWWLSGDASLGLSLVTGAYGFTLTNASLSSVGWHAGLRVETIFN